MGEDIACDVMYQRGVSDARQSIASMIKHEIERLEAILVAMEGDVHFEDNEKGTEIVSKLKYTYQIEQCAMFLERLK